MIDDERLHRDFLCRRHAGQRHRQQQSPDHLWFNARFTAAITLRWTANGFPAIRAPAAAGCPPPPNSAAISFTFTLSLLERRLIRVRSGSISSNTHATTTGSIARI